MKIKTIFLPLPIALIVIVGLFTVPRPARAQLTCTSLATPVVWTNSSGWNCGVVPGPSDTAIIASGHDKIVNVDVTVNTVIVNGDLFVGLNSTPRTFTVLGNFTINSGGTFVSRNDVSTSGGQSHTVNIAGNLTNDGTFDGTATSLGNTFNTTFNGTITQTISGSSAAQFNGLTTADTASVVVPAGSTQPTVDGTLTNNGTLVQAQTVNNASVPFLEIQDSGTAVVFRGVNISTTTDLGAVTVSIRGADDSGGEYCTTTGAGSPTYADRCYDITPTTSGTVLIRLWATITETNGIAESNLAVYHFVAGSGWSELTTSQATGNDGGSYVYAEGEISSFSPFLLGGINSPTAVSLQTLSAGENATLPWLLLGGLLGLLFLSVVVARHRRRPGR